MHVCLNFALYRMIKYVNLKFIYMYYKNKIHKTTKVMASLRILNIILKRFQSCFIHILANRARAKFEVKNKSIRALSRIFFSET